MSEIYSIVYQPAPSEHTPPYRYNRAPVESARLIAGHGLEGDLKAGHHPERHLNILSYETLDEMRSQGYHTAPGEMGEQLIVRGLDVLALEVGDRLQLGADALVEITKQRTGCAWFAQVQGIRQEDIDRPLGVLAQVIRSGFIRVGDPVKVLAPPHEHRPGQP
jgi:MOSC domain-containing protein YiiM